MFEDDLRDITAEADVMVSVEEVEDHQLSERSFKFVSAKWKRRSVKRVKTNSVGHEKVESIERPKTNKKQC